MTMYTSQKTHLICAQFYGDPDTFQIKNCAKKITALFLGKYGRRC